MAVRGGCRELFQLNGTANGRSQATSIAGKEHKMALFSGGDGSSIENAVVVNAASEIIGVAAEYAWLESRLGPCGDR